jgi:hypothetical protein
VPHSCGADGQVLEGFLERCGGELDLAEAEAVKFAELQAYKKHIDAQLEAGAGALILLVPIHSNETYQCMKRDLLMHVKRPTNACAAGGRRGCANFARIDSMYVCMYVCM